MAGCALVLGDIPSLRELWGGAALFVPPDDSEAILHTLRALCAHRDRVGLLGSKALARSRRFRPQRMTGAYWDAYRSLNGAFAEPSEQQTFSAA